MQNFEFKFPEDTQVIRSISNLSQLKIRLNCLQSVTRLNIKLRFIHHKNRFIYVRCTHCSSKLTYKFLQASQTYELIKQNTNHNHRHYRYSRSTLIQNFIESLPKQLSMKSVKILMEKQLKLKCTSFYYYYHKVLDQKFTMSQLVQYLDSLNYQLICQPYGPLSNDIPDLFLIISPQMKQSYQIYGFQQWMTFDFTFNLFSKKESLNQQSTNWKLGAFLGLSRCGRIIPFGLVVSKYQTSQTYISILKSFELAMGSLPKVIISDESPALKSCIQYMNNHQHYQIHHTFDIYHILHNVKKQLKRKQNLSFFKQLAKCQNEYQFQQILQYALENMDNEEDMKILERFTRQGQNYCFSLLPTFLLGFGSSDGINQKYHDLLKSEIPMSKSYTTVIVKSLKVLNYLYQRAQRYQISKIPIENYYMISELKVIRYSIDKYIVKKFIDQLKKTINLDISEKLVDEVTLIVIDQKNKGEFLLKLIHNGLWKCSCKYQDKTGIICCHQIKVCLYKKQKLLPYISQRWVCAQLRKSMEPSTSRLIIRKTRRNRLR